MFFGVEVFSLRFFFQKFWKGVYISSNYRILSSNWILEDKSLMTHRWSWKTVYCKHQFSNPFISELPSVLLVGICWTPPQTKRHGECICSNQKITPTSHFHRIRLCTHFPNLSFKDPLEQWRKNPGCLGYIRDYTTQLLYGNYFIRHEIRLHITY